MGKGLQTGRKQKSIRRKTQNCQCHESGDLFDVFCYDRKDQHIVVRLSFEKTPHWYVVLS